MDDDPPARSGAVGVAVFLLVLVIVSLPYPGARSPAASAHVPHDVISRIAVSPTFATDRTLFLISRHRLMRSVDGGSSWVETVRGITGDDAIDIAIAPSDPRTLYLATADAGTFTSRNHGHPGSGSLVRPKHITVSPNSSTTAFMSVTTDGLFRTTDGGRSWNRVGPFGVVTALHSTAAWPPRRG